MIFATVYKCVAKNDDHYTTFGILFFFLTHYHLLTFGSFSPYLLEGSSMVSLNSTGSCYRRLGVFANARIWHNTCSIEDMVNGRTPRKSSVHVAAKFGEI